MEVFAQGLVGKIDLFIHPNYVSAVYPLEGPLIVAFAVLVIGFAIFAIAIHMFEKRMKERNTNKAFKRPPPAR